MRTLKLISILTVMASSLLPSCMLLEPSPLYSPSSFSYYDDGDNVAPVLDDTTAGSVLVGIMKESAFI